MNRDEVKKEIEEALGSWSPEDTNSITDEDLDALNADLDSAIDTLRDREVDDEDEP